MIMVKKVLEISASHHLCLPYESPCQNVHGHNWKITVYCGVERISDLNNGMVVDFARIKSITQQLDHTDINSMFEPLNPTAENIAMWIQNRIPHCFRVDVQESEGNTATYIVFGTSYEMIMASGR